MSDEDNSEYSDENTIDPSEDDEDLEVNEPEPTDINTNIITIGNLPPIVVTKPESPAPPIPSELIQPSPVQLTVPKPAPKVIIQGANTEQVNIVPTQQVQRIQVPTKTLTLDDLLVKRDTETDDFFLMRSMYSRVTMNVFQGKMAPATAILIGQMGADKAMYGVTYPEETDRVIRYINAAIMKQ